MGETLTQAYAEHLFPALPKSRTHRVFVPYCTDLTKQKTL